MAELEPKTEIVFLNEERLVNKLLDISERVHFLLKEKGMSQKDLAVTLNKSESEISKWLSGSHNFELKTIIRIESALKEEVVIIPSYINKTSS
ncbi:helix-turn-helix domain-containing protein [Spirosoma gilvum]